MNDGDSEKIYPAPVHEEPVDDDKVVNEDDEREVFKSGTGEANFRTLGW